MGFAENCIVHNELMTEERKDLPDLFTSLENYQTGLNKDYELFLYYFKKVEKGKGGAYIVSFLRHWDKSINSFLSNMKHHYANLKDMTYRIEAYNNRYMGAAIKTNKFDPEELEFLFTSYMSELPFKINVQDFKRETTLESLNALRKYIKIDFENNELRQRYNEKMGVRRVQVDREVHYVKENEEPVFMDDLDVRTRDSDRVGFEEIVDGKEPYAIMNEHQFIVENYKEVLTKKQIEKLEKLLKHMKYLDEIKHTEINKGTKKSPFKNTIDDMFQLNNPSNFQISEISKVLFPERDITGTQKELKQFISSCRSRMNKALKEEEFHKEKVEVRSDYVTFPHLSPLENKLYKEKVRMFVIQPVEKSWFEGDKFSITRPKQFIPLEEVLKINYSDMTVSDLVTKYSKEIKVEQDKINKYNLITYKVTDGAGDMVVHGTNYEKVDHEMLDRHKEVKFISEAQIRVVKEDSNNKKTINL